MRCDELFRERLRIGPGWGIAIVDADIAALQPSASRQTLTQGAHSNRKCILGKDLPRSMSPLGLGRVHLPREGGEKPGPVLSQATIAAISGLVPTMFMTRVRL